MELTVISGARGSGKTTRLRGYVAALARAGRTIGGVASPAIGEDGRRIGYDLLDLRRGDCRPLARVVNAPGIVPTIGNFLFDESALAHGHNAIVAAINDGLDAVAIDEVGPLEWEGRGWAAALTHALAAGRVGQELIVVVRASLRERLAERFPSPRWRMARHISPP